LENFLFYTHEILFVFEKMYTFAATSVFDSAVGSMDWKVAQPNVFTVKYSIQIIYEMELFIIKRDGKKEPFSIEKIKNAIAKAFLSVGSFATQDMITNILSRVSIADETTVEDIQNQVEVALMAERYYAVAKSYMLYRQKHLEDREVRNKLKFLIDYCDAQNAASGSKYDANANVENKNMATLIGELPKSGFIRLNRRLLTDRLKDMFGKEVADRYIDLLNSHFIYKNDETSLANYCASITMYPWLIGGTASIGGNSKAPTNLKSFCGGFINMVFMVSSMLSGACATPEFLMYMNYFVGLEFGEDYYMHADKTVDLSTRQRTLDKVITDCFEQIVYSINQPTGARNFQAVFWNISYYDRYYFESLFEHFVFPNGSRPDWKSLDWLQRRFMKWFNAERTRTALTFPVETMALLTENGEPKDREYGDFTAEMYAEGHSFFTYMSDSADSLSSCCRLRNEIQDNGFSYTLGAGGVSTGSKSVLTVNLNRCVQHAAQRGVMYQFFLEEVVDLVHKVQLAYNENLKYLQEKGMLPLFDAGYINMDRQYLTIGVNGLVEAAEFLGIEITDNPRYEEFTRQVLGMIETYNKKYRSRGVMFNCEMIPAENVGIKHAKWDRQDGYRVSRDCYNSYFYIVEDDSQNIVDKFRLHGRKYIEHLTGGSALHLNLDEHLSREQYRHLLRVAAQEGCNYFTFNIPNTVCNDCGHIDKRNLAECPACKSRNLDYLTRIIGYMKRVSNFSQGRQKEAAQRHYASIRQL
jgi:ribonucleoside-triphosphate reductase